MTTLRLALKDIKAHRWRTLIGVLLFALPITAVMSIVVMGTSEASSHHESFDQRTHTTLVDANFFRCENGPNSDSSHSEGTRACGETITSATHQLEKLLGHTAYRLLMVEGEWEHGDSSGVVDASLVDSQMPGAPAPGTAMIDSRVAQTLGLSIGDSITITPQGHSGTAVRAYYALADANVKEQENQTSDSARPEDSSTDQSQPQADNPLSLIHI